MPHRSESAETGEDGPAGKLAPAPLDLRKGVVVALGGGGVRGVAHLGVLAELVEAGVVVRGMAGTSSGALMGALWAIMGSDGAIERVRSFGSGDRSKRFPDIAVQRPEGGLDAWLRRAVHGVDLVRLVLRRHLMSPEEYAEHVAYFLPDVTIESLALPFVAAATDNATGDEVWLDRGSLRRAVAASSAMPGLTPPVAWEGLRLQDGGAVAEIPVRAARSLGGPVVAVEVSEGMPVGDPDRDRLPKAMFRAAAMGWQELRRRLLADADSVIAPAVNHLHWADYHAIDLAVAAGRAAARQWLDGCPASRR